MIRFSKLTLRRGLPHPYASHPRLDLFVGSLSPHTLQNMGCTICHDGQGSATAFKWASHTPNDPLQAENWKRQYGWFDNHHWIFPMFPARFSESSCLKCHHDVVDLEPSEKFASAPAPKVTHGYQLIRKYGCFGCHEVNGYDGPDRRVGPDMRLEPNYFASAQALLPLLPAREAYFAKLAAEVPEDDRAQIAAHQETIRNVANLAPPNLRGRYSGMYSLVWGSGFIFAPVIGGLLFSLSPSLLWGLCALIAVFGAAVTITLPERSVVPSIAQPEAGPELPGLES